MNTLQHKRRTLLKYSLLAPLVYSATIAAGATVRAAKSKLSRSLAHRIGPLQKPDSNGIQLPDGFHSRIIAHSGQPVIANQPFHWHSSPDGGGCIPTSDGGWIYASNSEAHRGGASAIRFDAAGNIIHAYSILEGTHRNCAGGVTPWGSWLSCEEIETGRVWECDPFGKHAAQPRTALGIGAREAVCVDPIRRQLYLTEDRHDGGLYRYTPAPTTPAHWKTRANDQPYDLENGRLEIATGNGSKLQWLTITDPLAQHQPLRYQHPESFRFNGGEGIDYFDKRITFTTKGDNRVWSYHVVTQQLRIIYDAANFIHHTRGPVLTGVDNLTISRQGDILIAEDGGNLEVCVLDPNPQSPPVPLLRLPHHLNSELAGIAFNPAGDRLYFSSQRGLSGDGDDGISFEIRGPFLNT